MSLSELEQQNKFKKHLSQFWQSKGITQIKIPQIGGQQLNLYKLYKSVCRKGGGQNVSHNKMWKQIVDEFGLPSTCTSASFTLKNHYQRYLLAYQQKFYFGKDDNADLPQLVAGRLRKNMGRGVCDEVPNMMNKFQSIPKAQNQAIQQSTLQSDLNRYYDKADKNQVITYMKRSKMYPVTSEIKHMMLAFQSDIRQENIYAINILTMFSVNTQAPFLFHQYPNMLQSINSYVLKNYPPKNISILQSLRNLTLALRNLLMNNKNLPSMIDSSLLQTLLKIFNDKSDRQLTRNIVDIFSSMTKVGWNCKQLTMMIQEYLQKDTPQDLQTGIDLLRALVQQRQQLCEDIITRKLDLFSRLLVHNSIDNRQAVLEIFAYIIEKSDKIRNTIINNYKFMSRILAFMSCSSGINQKQAQLAGFILGTITHTPSNLKILKQFQKQLMLISFADQNLSSITTSFLFSINNPTQLESADAKKQQ